jgi:hypothetical protein
LFDFSVPPQRSGCRSEVLFTCRDAIAGPGCHGDSSFSLSCPPAFCREKEEAAQVNLCRSVHESLSFHGFKHRKSTLLRSQ